MQSQLEMAVGTGNNFLIINECCFDTSSINVAPCCSTLHRTGTGHLSHHTDKVRDAALSDCTIPPSFTNCF